MPTRAALSLACILVLAVAVLAPWPPGAGGEASKEVAAWPEGVALTGRVGGPVGDVVADGRRVYASIDFQVQTFDLTDPYAPRLIDTGPVDGGRPVLLPGNLDSMVLAGNRLYGLVDWDRQLPVDEETKMQLIVLARVSDLAPWGLAGTVDLPSYTAGRLGPAGLDMAVDGDRAYVASYYYDDGPILAIVDVADATAPRLAGQIRLDATAGLAVAGNYVYAAEWSNDATTLLKVIDVTSVAAATQIAEIETVGAITDIVVADGMAFVIGCGGLQAFDLSEPAQPRPLGATMPFPPAGVPPTPGPGPTPTPEPGGSSPMECYYWAEAEWRDGYLYAMTSRQTGLMTGNSYLWRIDVRDPGRPTVLGALEVPDGGESLSLGDRMAVVGGDSHRVIDQAEADLPRVAARLSDRWQIGEVVAADGNLAVRSQAYGFEGAIEFIDLADEGIARRAGAVPLSGAVSARDLVLEGHVAYAALREQGVLIIDATDPQAPRLVATVPPLAELSGLAVEGTNAYIAEADSDGGARGALRVLDVGDPAHPVELARIAGDFGPVAVNGTYIYAGGSQDEGLRVIDAGDPATMHVESVHATVGPVRQLAVSGVRLLALSAAALYVFDVSEPASPRELGHVDVRVSVAGGFRRPAGVPGLAVLDDVAYVGASGLLQGFDIRDSAAPRRLFARQVPGIGRGSSGIDLRVPSGGDVTIAGQRILVTGDGTGLWMFLARMTEGPQLYMPRAMSRSD